MVTEPSTLALPLGVDYEIIDLGGSSRRSSRFLAASAGICFIISLTPRSCFFCGSYKRVRDKKYITYLFDRSNLSFDSSLRSRFEYVQRWLTLCWLLVLHVHSFLMMVNNLEGRWPVEICKIDRIPALVDLYLPARIRLEYGLLTSNALFDTANWRWGEIQTIISLSYYTLLRGRGGIVLRLGDELRYTTLRSL